MTPKTFKKYMQCGLGRCYIELKNCDDIEKFRNTVLWGCLHEISFDAQCEGTRAAFLYRLITLFPDQAFFVNNIAEKYCSISGRNTWLFQQLTELLSRFAEDGYQTAKDSLSEKYTALYDYLLKKRNINGYDYQRDNFEFLSIVYLESKENSAFDKLIFDYGNLFLKNRHYSLEEWFDWFVDSLEETIGKKKLVSELKKHKDVPEWKCFYNSYLKQSKQKQEHLNSRITVIASAEEVLDSIDSEQRIPMYKMHAFSRSADASEKKKLADLIEKDTSLEKKAEMLKAFWRENYPGDHNLLIEYADSDCEALSAAAKEALSNCQSETVYQYAKECVRNNKWDDTTINILLMNYHKEDKELLLSLLYELEIDYDSESGWHGVALQILNTNDRGVHLPKEFFAYIYEKSLCSCCRFHAISYMGKRRWLSSQMIDECQYDSNSDIVSYINRKKRS